jgi:hypothetical protein
MGYATFAEPRCGNVSMSRFVVHGAETLKKLALE